MHLQSDVESMVTSSILTSKRLCGPACVTGAMLRGKAVSWLTKEQVRHIKRAFVLK